MKKIYILPNLVTTANLFCGFYSIIASIKGDAALAAWSILAAGIFDMLDGRIARLAKATSEFGVEYDSMSDLTSFGVAPGILLYQWALGSLDQFAQLGWAACFLYVACGAMRLARFNVNSGDLPKNFFQGMPIPMAAGIVSSFILFNQFVGWPSEDFMVTRQTIALVLALGLAGLMVSTVKFPSFKEVNWRSRSSFGFLFIGVVSMILIAIKPQVTLFLILIGYTLVTLFLNLVWKFKKT
jgi:CDP-diacylglycerol--serine O-phosphatidyltransferase